jgi:hypothetical protein
MRAFISRGLIIIWTISPLVGMTTFLGGCAFVEAVPIQPGSNTTGIPIPQVKPLLVVGSSVQVIMVPNTNKQYALRFGSFLAKHDLTVDLTQGMLQSIVSNQDSTAVPVAFLAALGQAAAAGHNLLGGAFAAQASTGGGRLQIYDIVFDDDGNLVGLKPLIRKQDLIVVPNGIQVSVPQPQTVNNNTPAPGTTQTTPAPTALPGGGAQKKPDCTTVPKPAGCT